MTVSVSQLATRHPDRLPVEVVERKGLGHPDTLCDALSEELSIALTRFYHQRFERVLHHNVDKALLWAGTTTPRFGGGTVLEPIQLFLAGRATLRYRGLDVPVDDLAQQAVHTWLQNHMHALDPAKHVCVRCLVRPSSEALVKLSREASRHGIGYANDSSCGTGYAPLSTLEQVVLAVERELTSRSNTETHPEVGEDVKVLGIRRGSRIDLTVAFAAVDRFLTDPQAYMAAKELVSRVASKAAQQISNHEITVHVNTADDPAAGRYYLTVTGTSGEAGDDGQAGRGNRVGGLITPCRPMVMESAAGKNPITHVGKMYSVAAHRIAKALVNRLEDVSHANCMLVSQIGSPVDAPQLAEVQLGVSHESQLETLHPAVEEIVQSQLCQLGGLWEETLRRAVRLY